MIHSLGYLMRPLTQNKQTELASHRSMTPTNLRLAIQPVDQKLLGQILLTHPVPDP